MEYNDLVKSLLNTFPELMDEYEIQDHIQELPHCVFSMILVPQIEEWLRNKEILKLEHLGVLLEQMAISKDVKVREVVNVSVLEPLVLGKDGQTFYFEKFLGAETLANLHIWRSKYKE